MPNHYAIFQLNYNILAFVFDATFTNLIGLFEDIYARK